VPPARRCLPRATLVAPEGVRDRLIRNGLVLVSSGFDLRTPGGYPDRAKRLNDEKDAR
jgi:hypothetical protein